MKAFAPPDTELVIKDRIRSVTILDPLASDEFGFGVAQVPITIGKIYAYVRGTTPSATWTIRYDSDRSAVGVEVITGGTVTTSEAGVTITSFTAPAIPVDNYIWFEVSAVSGTIEELFVGFVFNEG